MNGKYESRYSIEIKIGAPGGESRWIWAIDRATPKALKSAYSRIITGMKQEDIRVIRNTK